MVSGCKPSLKKLQNVLTWTVDAITLLASKIYIYTCFVGLGLSLVKQASFGDEIWSSQWLSTFQRGKKTHRESELTKRAVSVLFFYSASLCVDIMISRIREILPSKQRWSIYLLRCAGLWLWQADCLYDWISRVYHNPQSLRKKTSRRCGW